MSKQSIYTLAALASATMPTLQVAGARKSEQYTLDEDAVIQTAVITDTVGHQFDVCVSTQDSGKQLLKANAAASQALLQAKDPAGLGFEVERVVAFSPGDNQRSVTGATAVLVRKHGDGSALNLNELTDSQLASVGTAIGAIHRLRPQVATKQGYPAYSADQIRKQLVQWIEQLRHHGQVPSEIIDNWHTVITTTQELWSFNTCLVHGGFEDGDMLFSSTGLNAIYHWANMQVNDPARDLAWTFDKLDARQRTIVFSAYARLVGSHLDEMIMLRAVLWRQMDQVGAFMKALDRADNNAIMLFKSKMEELAHQIALRSRNVNDPTRQPLHSPAARKAPQSAPAPQAVQHNSAQHNTETRRANIGSAPIHSAQQPVIGERLTDDKLETVASNAAAATAGVAPQGNLSAQGKAPTQGAGPASATIVLQSENANQHTPAEHDVPSQSSVDNDGNDANSGTNQSATQGNEHHQTQEPTQSKESKAASDELPTEVIPQSTPVGIERTDKHPTGYISLVESQQVSSTNESNHADNNDDADDDDDVDAATVRSNPEADK